MDNEMTEYSVENDMVNQQGHDSSAVDAQPRRRLQDDMLSNNITRKMNLNRRQYNYERRAMMSYYYYDGPARRLTIDRRLKTSDRRKSEEAM